MSKFIEVTLPGDRKVTLNTNNILKIEELKTDHPCKTKILFSNGIEIENILVREDYVCINEMLSTIESYFVEEDKKLEKYDSSIYFASKQPARSSWRRYSHQRPQKITRRRLKANILICKVTQILVTSGV